MRSYTFILPRSIEMHVSTHESPCGGTVTVGLYALPPKNSLRRVAQLAFAMSSPGARVYMNFDDEDGLFSLWVHEASFRIPARHVIPVCELLGIPNPSPTATSGAESFVGKDRGAASAGATYPEAACSSAT